MEAFQEHLTQGAYMDSALKIHMEECEVEMTFEELKILREIAMKTVAETEAAAEVCHMLMKLNPFSFHCVKLHYFSYLLFAHTQIASLNLLVVFQASKSLHQFPYH